MVDFLGGALNINFTFSLLVSHSTFRLDILISIMTKAVGLRKD